LKGIKKSTKEVQELGAEMEKAKQAKKDLKEAKEKLEDTEKVLRELSLNESNLQRQFTSLHENQAESKRQV
jgi:hypothetical protein